MQFDLVKRWWKKRTASGVENQWWNLSAARDMDGDGKLERKNKKMVNLKKLYCMM